MCSSIKMLKRVADRLVDKRQEKFKEIFMHTYKGKGYYVELIFNGGECFMNLHSVNTGIKGKKITDESQLVDFLKGNNLKILEKFKYFSV